MGIEDKTSTDYHLTPGGWIAGTERYFDTVQKEIPPPLDCVETRRITCEQASGWSAKTYRYWTPIWKSPSIGKADLEALYQKFPPPKTDW